MTAKNCLNCNKTLTDKYCSGCGQKADTHRITFRNFIHHDVLHGTFHIDKGMLYTAKQALIRPGKAALDYISGKRVRYYNVFYLILISIGLLLFFRHTVDTWIYGEEAVLPQHKPQLNQASQTIDAIFKQKSKIIIFLFVPLAALNSFILFRRKKLNLSEHFIIGGMILLGILLLNILGYFLFYLDYGNWFSDTFLSWLIVGLCFLYTGYAYFNAFSEDYSTWGILYRVLLFFGLIALEAFILLLLLIGYATNWKMGVVTLSPFS
ncbi:DUF3667 domain-containing protein [Flavobacterium sp. CYK-4]|uniref:DUF3667 domain-containing protein n=1 Tax=Flavobacterium lotistagni TaxID=2709660 RepID=UPI00140B6783|nr:DUF3667 domain-containing protein [Flavobacterium lotistagni]NHM06323.1 DUF3667 domain-containing protein [Flavobacterium lotistagni]